jgi:hypothetical protein
MTVLRDQNIVWAGKGCLSDLRSDDHPRTRNWETVFVQSCWHLAQKIVKLRGELASIILIPGSGVAGLPRSHLELRGRDDMKNCLRRDMVSRVKES